MHTRSIQLKSFIALVIAVISAYQFVPDIDICPLVQEDLDDPKVAFHSSPVENGESIL
jgi:hypothetical protein